MASSDRLGCRIYLSMVIIVGLVVVDEAEGLACLECNVYAQAKRGTECHSPLNRTECVACLKIITKVKMNDGWMIRRTAEVESKYCARVVGSPGLREEGCYYQQNNGGYTEQCFCYTDGCNKAAQLFSVPSIWTYLMLSLSLCALFLF